MDAKFKSIPSSEISKQKLLSRELSRLILLSLSVGLLFSLVSYLPTDPSWSTWSSKSQLHNWMGRSGSIVADLLLQTTGLTAFLLALLPAILAFRKFHEALSTRKIIVTQLLLLISLSTIVQLVYPKGWMPWQLKNPGGIVGDITARLFTFSLGTVGAMLASLSLFAASLITAFQWRVLYHLTEFSRKLVALTLIGLQKLSKFRPWERAESSEKGQVAVTAQVLNVPTAPVRVAAEPPADRGETKIELPGGLTLNPVYEAPKQTIVSKLTRQRPPKPRNEDFQLPALSMISGKAESKAKPIDKSWYLEKANILVQKLKDFGVEGEVVNISPGPVITVYEFKPASGVKIKEISNLSDDLTLALSVLSVRIVAPIPGKPVVGIEIPSPHREMVFFKDLVEETPFFGTEMKIPIVLGRLASGEPLASDLASMPHLLVAGSTGTGKSVFINTMISSLLFRFAPSQLKLILVDPKMVELSCYEGIPHLLLPVVVDSKKAVLALRWAVDEMERRYTAMHGFGVRHVDGYNARLEELKKEGSDLVSPDAQFLPYIVVVIDEYADLMAVVPKEVELSIARLAQKARASGIHLVLATQRPSTDVVTGTIKANFPSRISFRVASSIDSKTILDRTGADRLLGNGDLLFHSPGFNNLRRMQGPYLSDADLTRVVEYLKEQGEPEYDERILQQAEALDENPELPLDGSGDDDGRLYDAAVRLVTERGEASISLIQRHLKIGYNRAATLVEQMEKEGVVGPAAGAAKRRMVLVNSL